MKIDKSFLMNYLLSSKENEYILNLYKIYRLSNKVANNDINDGKKILYNLEDKIYTVKGKTLSQKERILFDFKRIVDEYSLKKNNKKEITDELEYLIGLLEKCDYNDSNSLEVIKQKITILEAKFNLPINYLYSASEKFLKIYETLYINNKVYKNNDTVYNNDEKIYTKDIWKNDYLNNNEINNSNLNIHNKEDINGRI